MGEREGGMGERGRICKITKNDPQNPTQITKLQIYGYTYTCINTCTRIMYNNIPFPNSHTWYPRPSLSTSSISISGFSVCTFFKLCITLPGIAPTYVLLCPFISATSVIPPTLNLKYYQTHTHTHTHTVVVVLVYCIVLLLYLHVMSGQLNELY